MPAPWSYEPAGRWHQLEIESAVLRDNLLRDPHVRPLVVYTPPGYDSTSDRRYPSLYVLQGFTGQVDMWRNRNPFRKNFPELIDQLFAAPDAPPACVVVLVDAWTSLGGAQFLDSPATGRYHSYLCSEVVPFVDANFKTLNAAAHRGVTGKSSGGYGAMVTAMLRPDLFLGIATHAGDALFEVSYLPDFREAARLLRDGYASSFDRFLEDFRSRPALSRSGDHVLLETYAMAACYSAEADGTVALPFDVDTGRLRPDVWERWLRWDPVRMAAERGDALRGMRAIWIDAGRRDEFFLDLGAAALREELARVGVPDQIVHYELFEGTHGGIEYRYPLALRFLAERLSAA
ncbi:MAG TPA: alpha/beta hydrolase-fold protein [Candidatus Dormibacteraeota bacterium]